MKILARFLTFRAETLETGLLSVMHVQYPSWGFLLSPVMWGHITQPYLCSTWCHIRNHNTSFSRRWPTSDCDPDIALCSILSLNCMQSIEMQKPPDDTHVSRKPKLLSESEWMWWISPWNWDVWLLFVHWRKLKFAIGVFKYFKDILHIYFWVTQTQTYTRFWDKWNKVTLDHIEFCKPHFF